MKHPLIFLNLFSRFTEEKWIYSFCGTIYDDCLKFKSFCFVDRHHIDLLFDNITVAKVARYLYSIQISFAK